MRSLEEWQKQEQQFQSLIVEEIKRPRANVATILRKYRLGGNIQTAKCSDRHAKKTSRDHRHYKIWREKSGKHQQVF